MLYILKSISVEDLQLTRIWNEILKVEWILQNECYILKDVYNKIIIELLIKSRINNNNNNNNIKEFLNRAQNILNMPSTLTSINNNNNNNNQLGSDCYQLSNIKLLIHLKILQLNNYNNNESTIEALIDVFIFGLSSKQNNEVISYCLDCLLLLLNNNNNNSYLLNDFELNDVTFINILTFDNKSISSDLIRNQLKMNKRFNLIFKDQLQSINTDTDTDTDDVCKSKLYYLLNIIYKDDLNIIINQLFNLNDIHSLYKRFIELCSIESESIICFIFNCINQLLLQLVPLQVQATSDTTGDYKYYHHDLICSLYYNASSSMPYKTRQAVAQLIVTHPQLYTSASLIQGTYVFSCSLSIRLFLTKNSLWGKRETGKGLKQGLQMLGKKSNS